MEIITTLSYWTETWAEIKFQLVQHFLTLHSDVHKQSYWKNVCHRKTQAWDQSKWNKVRAQSTNNERFNLLVSWLIFQGLLVYLLFISGQCYRKFRYFFPSSDNLGIVYNVLFTDFMWCYKHLLARFRSVSELSNMERLDITLTKFIKLHVLLLMLGLGYIIRTFWV